MDAKDEGTGTADGVAELREGDVATGEDPAGAAKSRLEGRGGADVMIRVDVDDKDGEASYFPHVGNDRGL